MVAPQQTPNPQKRHMSSSTKSVVVKQKKVHPSTPVSTPSASRLVREGFELQPQIFVWTIWTNFCLYIFVFFYISVIKVQYTTRQHSYLLISAKLLFVFAQKSQLLANFEQKHRGCATRDMFRRFLALFFMEKQNWHLFWASQKVWYDVFEMEQWINV